MTLQDMSIRLEAKSPEQQFLHLLEQDYHFASKIAQAILYDAQSCLHGTTAQLRPGQIRVILAKRRVSHARPLAETDTVTVTWTVDAGQEDQQVLRDHGRQALRRVRIQRLLLEAVEQGAAASQEDLCRVLNVSLRTVKRDFVVLQGQGVYLPTRGNLQGIGRGQTHKAQIVGHWLGGATYDQIAQRTHHSLSSIRRYIQTFVRVVELHRRGFAESQIALLVQIGPPLVREYLAVYDQNDSPVCRQRLEEQLQRLSQVSSEQKKGAP